MTHFTNGFDNRNAGCSSKMSDQIILDLMSYWEGLRAGRIVPARAEIDPRAIKPALENTFILEKVRNGGPRIRLAGTKVCDLLAMELRGMPARSLIVQDNREEFETILNDVLWAPQIVELDIEAQDKDGREHRARMLLLPLKDHEGETSRVIGCVSLQSERHNAPLRFRILKKHVTRIVAGEALEIDKTPRVFPQTSEAFDPELTGLREVSSNPDAPSSPRSGKKPFLRLVKNDK